MNATRGSVARVAARLTTTANMSPRRGEAHHILLVGGRSKIQLDQGADGDNANAIPATAVKLNWKDTSVSADGLSPAIIPAARARAGRMLLVLPKATTVRYTLTMIAARSTDGDRPLRRA